MMKVVRLGLVAVVLSAVGCASPSADPDDLAPVGEGDGEMTSVSALVGSYGEGKGRFASLVLAQTTEGGTRRNTFEAEQIVQCVRAPCPTVNVKGRWFARGTTLSLYPEGDAALTFRTKIQGDSLVLSDKNGTAIAELVKQPAAVPGVAEALAKYGVSKMKVKIEPSEVNAQAGAPGVTKKFAEAVDTAVSLFLHDAESGLASWVAEQDPADLEACGREPAGEKRVACVANTGASVRLLGRSESPPGEGDVATEWVLVFSDGRSDYGYFAIVPKKGNGAASIYAFN